MAGKTSGTFAAGGLLLMIALAVIYIFYVDDWYRNHAAVICTPQLKLAASPTDYCYVRASITRICNPYDGMCNWIGDDRISEFFENLSKLVVRWVEEAIGPMILRRNGTRSFQMSIIAWVSQRSSSLSIHMSETSLRAFLSTGFTNGLWTPKIEANEFLGSRRHQGASAARLNFERKMR